MQNSIDLWIKKNISEGENFQERLAEVVQYVGREQGKLVERLIKDFSNHEMYIERPAVKIYEGKDGKTPNIYVLGWRCEEGEAEETDIHDHQDSEVAVFVYKGNIEEEIYAFDTSETLDRSRLAFKSAKRSLGEGSTLNIPAPYIHIVRATQGQDVKTLSVSIHAYYPPLDEMTLFKIEGGDLVAYDHWKEEKGDDCHC